MAVTMDVGFETVGNATLICHDRGPVLVTDPWISGSAYFGSWGRSHEIPAEQMDAIHRCKFVWLSHGHPDHLSSESLHVLRTKTILLPDHVGGRIFTSLKEQGYEVHILKDRVWTDLSDRIKIMCIADYFQDAILLVDLNGRLLVNKNDANDRGWKRFVKRIIKQYHVSFLLSLSGFGDADMINFVDEGGTRILPYAARKYPVGRAIAAETEDFGTLFFVPFSSFHKYQRKDSVWAEEYRTTLADYPRGYYLQSRAILPAFIRYDCLSDAVAEIAPPESPAVLLDPEHFDDKWAEPLEASDVTEIRKYFKSFAHLAKYLDFVNVRVGGKDNVVELGSAQFERGITFAAPRHSLMLAVRHEIFDDLLIGNFMKTTLHGKWTLDKLYPDFTPFVAKYGDNGRAKSDEELAQYFEAYKRRAPIDFVRHELESRSKHIIRGCIPYESGAYRLGRRMYWSLKTSWRSGVRPQTGALLSRADDGMQSQTLARNGDPLGGE